MSAGQIHIDESLTRLRAGDLAGAAAALEAALAAQPDHVDARYRLGNIYRDLSRLDDAERELRAVVRQRANDAKAHSALGIVLLESGRACDAVAAYEEAMRLDPRDATAATNWLNAQQYVDGVTEVQLAAAHARWAALHPPPATPIAIADRGANRPLNVGFVSPDLARHPVGRLAAGLFENLDPARVRPLVFSTRPAEFEDDVSRRIARVTRWTTVFGLSDAALGAFIRNARTDILIDMSGHTAHHRLKVFAARAAPVQVSWLGYAGTTGVPAMDYLLATEAFAPPGSESYCTEKIFRMPRWHACFEPPVAAPAVGPLPAARNGYVTFGCFNNPAKIGDAAIASMAAIMTRLPGSRLALRYRSFGSPDIQARLRAVFSGLNIGPERVNMAGNLEDGAFLDAYNGVDIALETFPYSGSRTTCEAAWMGCPVVTFSGATFAGRQSAAFLTAAGLSELVARDRRGYEQLALDLAGDLDRLAEIRAELRAKIAASPVCDGAGFARDFTAAVQTMWAAAG